MQNNVKRKIKSAPRTGFAIVFAAALLVLVGFVLFGPQTSRYVTAQTASGKQFELFKADTPALRTRGLSDRRILKQHEGMLFIYNSLATRCIWMKDMLVPIDILWLDSSKRVLAVERRVFPDTYPEQFCHPGRYVIEISIGTAHAITPGQQLQF